MREVIPLASLDPRLELVRNKPGFGHVLNLR
jgi:hypothetical protein